MDLWTPRSLENIIYVVPCLKFAYLLPYAPSIRSASPYWVIGGPGAILRVFSTFSSIYFCLKFDFLIGGLDDPRLKQLKDVFNSLFWPTHHSAPTLPVPLRDLDVFVEAGITAGPCRENS